MNLGQCLKRLDPKVREILAKRIQFLFDSDIQAKQEDTITVSVEDAIFLLGSNAYKSYVMSQVEKMVRDYGPYPMAIGLPEELKRLKQVLLEQQATGCKLVDAIIWHNNPKPEPIELPTICKGPQSADCPAAQV